ncbi:S9 family peptidase [bacterium]|nr:MAG: S9 family peptidase [bacterium]
MGHRMIARYSPKKANLQPPFRQLRKSPTKRATRTFDPGSKTGLSCVSVGGAPVRTRHAPAFPRIMLSNPIFARRTVAVAALSFVSIALLQAQNAPVNKANWKQAERYTSQALAPYFYSTGLTPNWINKGDSFWYSWRASDGVHFWRVNAKSQKKEPLFDTAKMAALLSELTKRPYDNTNLPITTVTFDEKNDKLIRFTVNNVRYEYDADKETLKSLGAPTETPATPPAGGQGRGQGRGGRGGGAQGAANAARDGFRNYAPDRKSYVYAQDYNLYLVELDGTKEKPPVQITKDGERYYSFGSRQEIDERNERARLTNQQVGQGGQRQNEDGSGEATTPEKRVRANVTWSDDSKRFLVTRRDSRKVKDLFLVNSLTEPRPSLLVYRYDMPGEVDVTQTELWGFTVASKQFAKLPVEKFKDQTISNLHFQEKQSDKLRFSRRDRLQRNLEFCELDLTTNKVTPLITESVTNASLEVRPVRYVKPNGDMLWWSERSGWGHFYLYSNDGKLKNIVDSGPFRAKSIEAVDEKNLWFTAVGREQGENPYYQHLYRIGLDGKGQTLLDPGNADHTSSLSESKKFVVDVRSRTDLETQASLRDEDGKFLMDLEKTDVARLKEIGWAMPETFVVKAADGVTDLWGNMWKPVDFDPKKKYPIITYVYPGPQTEAVTTAFGPSSVNARLAQLGFIVISMGNRGGHPDRSNAYQNFSYFNMRDYGLADKKIGIEQLAARYPWIDADRVGIFGHSGGGFMTAAAMLLPPYNSFFKVGWSESGNHDNNVYNQNWAEQYHGLREVPATNTATTGSGTGTTRTTPDDEGFVPSFPDTPQFIGGSDGPTKFQIKVPTNAELASNLKGNLMLVHGDMDDNVHPVGTVRLINALIRANKRFDFMLLPGKPHGFGDMSNYNYSRMFEYFATHLLGDRYGVGGADLDDRK